MPGQTKEAAAKAPPKAGKPKREGEAKKEQQQQTPPTQHQGKKNQDSAANANGQQNKQNVDRDDPKNNPFYEEEKPFRDRIQAINKQMDGVRKKIQEIQAILQKKQDDRKDIFARKTEITSKLSALETQRRAIQVEKRALNNQLKDHFKALETKKSQIEKVRDQLPFKNDKSEDFVARNNQIIDKELRKFEIQMSEKLSLQEEKKLVGEIAIWRNMKNLIKDYDIQAELESIDRVKATLKASQSKIDDIIGAEDVILGDLQKAHQDVIKNGVGIQALFKDKDKFVAQLEEFAGKRRDVQKELQQYRKTRAEERRELRKKQDEEREKQRKAREEERKKRQEEFLEERKKKQAAREAKELLSVPYEEDLALCDNLISYLEGLNKTKAKNPKADLKIQWEVFLSFEHISLVPPTSFADVDKSLEEVKAKKEYYQKLSQEKLKQRAEKKAAAETEGEKPKEPEEKTEEKPEEKTDEKTEEKKEETKEETKEAESKGEEAKKEEAGGEN